MITVGNTAHEIVVLVESNSQDVFRYTEQTIAACTSAAVTAAARHPSARSDRGAQP